jgi:hypothetical protein
MIPPPSGPGQPRADQELTGQPQQPRFPEAPALSHQQAQPQVAVPEAQQGLPGQVNKKPGLGKTALIVALATLLVAGGGLGIWWFWLRDRGGSSNQQPIDGLQQAPAVAWEQDISQTTSIVGVPEGLVVAPDQAQGETEMMMLDWESGEKKWSVDVGPEVREATYIYLDKSLPGGLISLVMMNDKNERTMLVHRASDGQQVKKLNLGNGMLIPSNSEALYLFEVVDSAEGLGRISRIKSLEDFDDRQWTAEAQLGAGDVMVTAVEKNGHVSICWVDQFGDPERCPLSLSLEDGSKPPWYNNSLVSYEIGDVVITSDSMETIAAYDQQGQKLWERVQADESLKFIGDMILVIKNGSATVERLNPGTGQVMWTEAWNAGDLSGFLQNGRAVVVYSGQGFKAGVADVRTGKPNLANYPFENPRAVFRATDDRLILQDGSAEGEKTIVAAIKPGEPEPLWTKTFDGYTHAEQYEKKLVLRGSKMLAVLK